MSYTIEIKNLSAIRKIFKQYPQYSVAPLVKRTKEAGELIKEEEKRQAPKGSGKMIKGIKMEYSPIGVKIFPSDPYAVFVHEGTGIWGAKKRLILPLKGKVLAWKDRRTGKMIFAKSSKGQKPNPFVERTRKLIERPVNKIMAKALDDILRIIKEIK